MPCHYPWDRSHHFGDWPPGRATFTGWASKNAFERDGPNQKSELGPLLEHPI